MSYRVRFRVDGRQKQETFDEPESAEEFKRLVDQVGGDHALRVLAARHSADAGMPTLREFTYQYLEPSSGLLTGIEPGTRRGYRTSADASFLVVLGDYPVDAVQKADVGKWVAWQESQQSRRYKGQPVAAKTVKNYQNLLSQIFASAVEQKHRDDNPAHKIRLSKGTKREPVFLSPAEFDSILHFVPDYHKPLIMFLVATGCRWGEASAVKWGDINSIVTPATVRIERAWKKSDGGGPILKHPKSSKARRTISIPARAFNMLPERAASDRFLFVGPLSGDHLWYSQIRDRVWERAVDKAMDIGLCAAAGLTPLKLRPTIHDLRHTHASWLIAAGVPLPYIQVRLGHESITTTVGVYGHLVPDAHEKMATAIEATMSTTDVVPVAELEYDEQLVLTP